ncbi:acyl-CoA dehydrogenase [Nonomuraea sp. NPDC050451]|uniref:acyl-CoA dehydrogenase n=1 Tax=Nonomuraea sp. NPDC050451 TaxID=3364364 RepID=UPI0037B0D4E4
MGIGTTEEHQALTASVRGLATRTTEHAALAGQGILGLHLPEECGGQGYGLLELCVALEALGERRVAGAYLPTVLTSAALTWPPTAHPAEVTHPETDSPARDATVAGPRTDRPYAPTAPLIAGLADGSMTAAVAFPAEGGEPGRILALGSPEADLFLVPVDGRGWAVLDRADVVAEPADGVDLDRPLCSITARTVPADRVLGEVPVRELAAVLLGADACGVAAWAVRTAAEYAKVREQFGRPIGQFQGVKHRVAAALVTLEQARAAVWDAARALDATPGGEVRPATKDLARDELDGEARPTAAQDLTEDRPGDEARPTAAQDVAGGGLGGEVRLAVAVAGVLGTEAAVRCAADAIQVLGGIGYTFEHDAHRYYRRALSDRMLAGDPGPWAEEVCGLAVAGVRRAMEPDLPEEASAVRDAIRAEAESLRAEEPLARLGRFAREGWIMPYLPRPWGRDASPLEQVIIHQEFRDLKRPNLGIAAWAVPSIVRYGTREQQERFLPKTFTGEIVWCQLFSEPDAGSDLAGLATKATRVEGGWSLTGQKIWTSLAQYAHWGICLARTSPEKAKHNGITYFLVDMASQGVTVRPLKEINGDEVFNEVFLDDVFVPDDLVVGAVDEGWRVARDTLSYERVALGDSWGPGSQHTDMAELIAKLPPLRQSQREQAGRLWAEGQAISALGLRATLSKLSDPKLSDSGLSDAGLSGDGSGGFGRPGSGGSGQSGSGAADRPGADAAIASSVRKLLGMRHAQAISEFCWSLTPASRHWSRMILATRAFTIGGGTTEVQLNIIAERALGLPRDP